MMDECPHLCYDMKHLKICWACVVISLSLLFWCGHVFQSDGSIPSPNKAIKGYVRILPGRRNKYLDMHCSECALVSSSGQMLGAGTGEMIDRTECVIRMNTAPTRGYEKDVGNKTTVRVVSHTSVPLLLKEESHYFKTPGPQNTVYVFWGPERNMRQDGKGRIFNVLLKIGKKYKNVSIYAVTKEKIQYCDQVFQNETGKNRMKTGAFLSTGFFTMNLAIEMCDSINVYGMVNDSYCSRTNHSAVPYHYYEQHRVDECRMYRVHEHVSHGGHRFITEKAIYAKWAKRYKIKFKHPFWSQ